MAGAKVLLLLLLYVLREDFAVVMIPIGSCLRVHDVDVENCEPLGLPESVASCISSLTCCRWRVLRLSWLLLRFARALLLLVPMLLLESLLLLLLIRPPLGEALLLLLLLLLPTLCTLAGVRVC